MHSDGTDEIDAGTKGTWGQTLGRRGVAAVEEVGAEGRRAMEAARGRNPCACGVARQESRNEEHMRDFARGVAERVYLGEIMDAQANALLVEYQDRLAGDDRAQQRDRLGARRQNPSHAPAEVEDPSEDEHLGEMLAIAADSDGTLYPLKKQIIDALSRRGGFDHERAESAFAQYIDEAAKVLGRERNEDGEDRRSWVLQYPKRVRRAATAVVAANVAAELRVARNEADANKEIFDERSEREGGRPRFYPTPRSAPDSLPSQTSRSVPAGEALQVLRAAGSAGVKAVSMEIASDPEWRRLLFAGPPQVLRDFMRAQFGMSEGDVTAATWTEPRLNNPLYPALGPASEQRRSNPVDNRIPLKLLQPRMSGEEGVAPMGERVVVSGKIIGAKNQHRGSNPADDEPLDVPEEILRQLGGAGALSMMIGAKQFVGSQKERMLQFKWSAKAKNGANTVVITLEPTDTYHVQFYSVRGMSFKEKGDFSQVYVDQLRPLFESQTHLRLRMNNPRDSRTVMSSQHRGTGGVWEEYDGKILLRFAYGKPSEAIKSVLKRSGWKWEPEVGAWARRDTPAARKKLREISGEAGITKLEENAK